MAKKQNPALRRWWLEEDDSVAVATLLDTADQILSHDEVRFRNYLRHARLYGGREWTSLVAINRALPVDYDDHERMRLNVVASCVDTAVAKLAKNRPAPQYVTNGADWKLRRKAEKLNKFGKGVLHQSGFYDLASRALREACIFGTTAIKMVEESGDVKAEPVYPWEILVDRAESERMSPRSLIQRSWIDREVLIDAYGKGTGASARIQRLRDSKAGRMSTSAAMGRSEDGDQIEVFEAWRLPSKLGAKDGHHVVCVRGGVLLRDDFTADDFPFAFLRWEDPIAGFWGVGIPERLQGIQFEINTLLQKIQRAFHLLGVPRVLLDTAAGIPSSHINNDIGAILKYTSGTGQPPVVISPQTVHPEIFAHLQWLYQRAFDEVGISQMSAQSRKPAGLDSGVALREFSDIEAERFVPQGRKWEKFHLDGAERGLDIARNIDGFTVEAVDKRWREEIPWKEVACDRKAYTLLCFPSSLLPQTPAGRLERVQELISTGFVSKEMGMELLDVPDLEEGMKNQLASRRHIRKQIANILDDADYEFQPPDPNLDLRDSLNYALGVYNEAAADGCPEDILENLRVYLEQLKQLVAPPPPEAPMPMGPPAESFPGGLTNNPNPTGMVQPPMIPQPGPMQPMPVAQ